MAATLTYAIALVTVMFAPIWVQHLTAEDSGLIALGGGKITQQDVDNFHPLMRHVCAVVAISNFAFSALTLGCSLYGDATVKSYVAFIYALWLSGILVVQYTHSWTGSSPAPMDMPNPLVYGALTVVALGWIFDSAPRKAKSD